jgi:hypothetical protein
MKLSQFRTLIREEVRKALKEDYIRKMNIYTDEFAQLSKPDYMQLNKLIQAFDKLVKTNPKFDDLVTDITSPGDHDDATVMMYFYDEVATEAKGKVPAGAKIASDIVKILSKIAD